MKTKNIVVLMILIAALNLSAVAFLGVMPGPKSRQAKEQSKLDYGIQIYEMQDNSPAAKAGLKENDIILKLDSEKVYTTDQFYKMVSLMEVGKKVKVVFERDGDKKTVKVVLEDKRKYGKPYLGIIPGSSAKLDKKSVDYDKDYGLYLMKIVESGPAAEAGIPDGAILMKVDGDKIFTIDQLLMMLKNYQVDQEVALTCFVKGAEKKYIVKLGLSPQETFFHGGIDFFNRPNNIFMYKYSDELADSLGGKFFELFLNGEEVKLPNFDNLMKNLDGFDNFWKQKEFDLKFDNIDFDDLEKMEIIINGEVLKLPEDIKNMNQEQLEKLIQEQMGDSEEHNIEIKILKTDLEK